MADYFDRITVSPAMMQGKPCVRGMRITVGLVVNLFANGMQIEPILKAYPSLKAEDIRQCLRFAAALAEEPEIRYEEPDRAVPR